MQHREKKIDTYPLLQSQLGVFATWASFPSGMQYNLPAYSRLDKSVNTELLKQAYHKLADIHPTMKTHFVITDGMPRQYVDEKIEINLQAICMPEADAMQFMRDNVRPFDLLSGEPLVRGWLIETEQYKYLFFDIHHCICDGTALGIVLGGDLSKLYAGMPLTPEPITIMQYAVEEEMSFQTDVYSLSKSYFTQSFRNLNLISLASGVKNPLGKEIRRSAFLPMEGINNWCEAHNLHPSILFLSAFAYVMAECVNDKRVAFSTLYHGRNDKRMRSSMGMFIKTIPLLANADRECGVLDFLGNMNESMKTSIKASTYPMSHFCRDMNQKVGVVFNYIGAIVSELLFLDGKKYSVNQLEHDLTVSDVGVSIYLADGEYEVRLDTSDKLHDANYIQTLANAVKNCVVSMIENCKGKLKDVKLLDAEEEKRIIQMSAGKMTSYDMDKTWVDAFKEMATRYPDNICVADDMKGITYCQVDKLSDTLAHAIIKKGVKPDCFVCVLMDRNRYFVVAALAIHKAAAAYVPLDVEYPADRLRYMISDCGSEVLLTCHAVYDRWNGKDNNCKCNKVVFVDDVDFTEDTAPICLTKPQQKAYMIYTSGSTGVPKGVVITQGSLYAFTNTIVDQLHLTAGDRISSHSSFSFDAHIEDIFPVLTIGGSVHIIPENIRKDITEIYRFITDHNITGGGYTTMLTQLLVQHFDLKQRYIIAGGEKLQGVVSRETQIINTYGPTESTVDATIFYMEQNKEYDNIPIGRSVNNCYCFIVGAGGQLLPQGFTGQLCFAGPQIAQGYWNQPELTQEKFVDCLFLKSPEKMYLTGDLARYNRDGELEFMGRVDNQVKVRGYRIELGEIETHLLSLSSIRQAVANVIEKDGEKHLVAYYTVKDGCTITEEQIKRHIRHTPLAGYMHPEVYMQIDDIPMLPSGKVNRSALPAPVLDKLFKNVQPTNKDERILLDIVRNILSTDAVGVTDDLFYAGLSSISAISIVMEAIRNNINISISELMRHRNVRDTLSAAHEICFMANEQNEGKPAVVVVCGVTQYHDLEDIIDRLMNDHTVYVIDNVSDIYDKYLKGMKADEAAGLFVKKVSEVMPAETEVQAFIGHSFGGELAYRMAVEWHEKTGQTPEIEMYDTHWTPSIGRLSLIAKLISMLPNDVDQQLKDKYGMGIDKMTFDNSIVSRMIADDTPQTYHGKVVLHRAMKSDTEVYLNRFNDILNVVDIEVTDEMKDIIDQLMRSTSKKEDNEAYWRQYVPHIICDHREYSHLDILKSCNY